MGRREKRGICIGGTEKGEEEEEEPIHFKKEREGLPHLHPIEDVTTVLLQRWRGNGRGGIWLQNSALHWREALDLLSLVSAGMTPRSPPLPLLQWRRQRGGTA